MVPLTPVGAGVGPFAKPVPDRSSRGVFLGVEGDRGVDFLAVLFPGWCLRDHFRVITPGGDW